MVGFSTFMQEKIAEWLNGSAMGSPPSALYIALFSADPTDAGVLTNEVTTQVRTAGRLTGPFTRVAVGATTRLQNSAIVNFGPSVTALTISHFGLFNAATGGNMYASGVIEDGELLVGIEAKFDVGTLKANIT